MKGLLGDEGVDDVTALLGGGVGFDREFGQAGGPYGVAPQTLVRGRSAVVDLCLHHCSSRTHAYQHFHLAAALASVCRNGKVACLAARQLV